MTWKLFVTTLLVLFLFKILVYYCNSFTTVANVLPFSVPTPTATGPCVAKLSPDTDLPPANCRLYLEWFSNTAFSRETNETNVVTYCSQLGINDPNTVIDPNCQVPIKYLNSTEFSLRWTGVLTVPITGNYTFYCYYPSEYSNLLLWIDDQILCPMDKYTAISLPLSIELSVPIRMEYIHWDKQISARELVIQVQWKRINDKQNTQSELEVIPNCTLNACTSYPEQQRHLLSDQLLHSGWNTYSISSMSTHVFMPDCLAVSLSLYNSATGTIWRGFRVEHVYRNDSNKENNTPPRQNVFAGLHSYMGSQYTEMHIEWDELLLTVETTVVSRRDLLIVVQVVNNDSQPVNLSNYFVLFDINYLFNRQGVCVSSNYRSFVSCTGIGLSDFQSFATQPQIKDSTYEVKHIITSNIGSPSNHQQKYKIQDFFSADNETTAFSLLSGVIGFSSNSFRNITDIQRSTANARADELQSYKKYGPELSENYRAIHNVIAWNTLYTVYEGIINVVSRRWDFGFGYVMFLWDSFLTSLIRSFDISGLDVALQTFIQVTKARTRNIDSTGLLPNYKSGTKISRDRTEPPIGSIMLLQLVDMQGTKNLTWFVDLVYPELYANLVWMWKHRMIASKVHPNISLIVLGSDPDNLPTSGDIEVDNLQAARYESGLDNSPMYDYNDFDNKTHKMQQFDIGMNSLFAAEAQALIQLIKYSSLSLIEEYKTLQYWLNVIVPTIESELWNLSTNLYLNRAIDTGEFNIHISPTSFFPLLIGLPSVTQAEKMVVQYLTNSSHFCVSSNCHGQPVPSISRSDSTYRDQIYWRGRVWGPHLYLIYTALSHSKYALSEIIQQARNSIVNQTDLMWRMEWSLYGHIHENYNGNTGAGCELNIASDPYYTWGAATAFLPLIQKYPIKPEITERSLLFGK